jgi:hypothetical protein
MPYNYCNDCIKLYKITQKMIDESNNKKEHHYCFHTYMRQRPLSKAPLLTANIKAAPPITANNIKLL